MAVSFFSTVRYFDSKNYPRGFSRYGFFTIRESQLLEQCGHAYSSLNNGKRKPITDDERRFVKVCRGICEPLNEHEKVWLKYIDHINKPKRFHTLLGGKPSLDITEDNLDD